MEAQSVDEGKMHTPTKKSAPLNAKATALGTAVELLKGLGEAGKLNVCFETLSF